MKNCNLIVINFNLPDAVYCFIFLGINIPHSNILCSKYWGKSVLGTCASESTGLLTHIYFNASDEYVYSYECI